MRNVTKQIKKIHCLILLLLLSCLPTLARNGIVTKETTGYEKGKTATGAYYTDKYRNLFNEYLGISQQQTNLKIEQIWHHFFVNEKQRFTMNVMITLPIFMTPEIGMCAQKVCPME